MCAVDLSGRISADICVCHLSIAYLINLISFSLGSRDIVRTGSQSARAFPQRADTDTLRNCVCSYVGRFCHDLRKNTHFHLFVSFRFDSTGNIFHPHFFYLKEYAVPRLLSRYSKSSEWIRFKVPRSRTNRPTNFDAVRHFYGLCFQ